MGKTAHLSALTLCLGTLALAACLRGNPRAESTGADIPDALPRTGADCGGSIVAEAGQPCGTAAVRRIVLLGDSMVWLGGRDCRGEKGWSRYFAEAMGEGIVCRSYARSGATWTHTPETVRDLVSDGAVLAPDNVIFNQVERLAEAVRSGRELAPDVVMIAAGVNDLWFLGKRPGALTEDADAVYGRAASEITALPPAEIRTTALAVRYACERLNVALPGVRIVLLTPCQSVRVPRERLDAFCRILADCAARSGVCLLRLDGPELIDAQKEKLAVEATYDGTHTSVAGARKIGAYVASSLKTLLSD